VIITRPFKNISWFDFKGAYPAPILLLVLFLTLGGAASTHAYAGSIPTYAQRVASGQAEDAAWSVWLYGKNNGARCWGTRGSGSSGRSEYALCGFSVPKRQWQLAAAGQIDNQPRRSFFFFLTRQDVAQLALKIHTAQGVKWYCVPARRLTAKQAAHAHIRRNFRYVVAQVPGQPTLPEVVVASPHCEDDRHI
jgi:hypothetical protein